VKAENFRNGNGMIGFRTVAHKYCRIEKWKWVNTDTEKKKGKGSNRQINRLSRKGKSNGAKKQGSK
jgi:hypothetical protein